MVHAINEDLKLDRIKTLLKEIQLVNYAFVDDKGHLIFRYTDGTQFEINLKEVVKNY